MNKLNNNHLTKLNDISQSILLNVANMDFIYFLYCTIYHCQYCIVSDSNDTNLMKYIIYQSTPTTYVVHRCVASSFPIVMHHINNKTLNYIFEWFTLKFNIYLCHVIRPLKYKTKHHYFL